MKKLKKCNPICALKTAVAALHLVITFLVLSCKKRSVWQAMLLMASTGLTLGVLLTPAEKLEKKLPCPKKKADPENGEAEEATDDAADADADAEEAEEEFFTEEESAEMEERMRHALGGDRDGETATAPCAKREIPRDEEASEADFQ